MKFCTYPFERLEIDVDGSCYCCCRWWNKSYRLGNILEQTPEEIWNGQEAQELRKSILDGTYKYCNLKECIPNFSEEANYNVVAEYPKEISFCYDYTCSAKCVFCNDETRRMPKDEVEKWDFLINTKIPPLLKNAKTVRLSGVGEIFMSEHSKRLIKEIAQKYPNIKFLIMSNGILCNKGNLEDLNIVNKIESIKISLPSIKEKTYKKLVRNGDLKSVKRNLMNLSQLKINSKGNIKEFMLNFVISSENYKELPLYVKYANSLGANVCCLLLYENNAPTKFLQEYDKYNVANPNHPQYNNFIKVINSPHLKKYKNVYINDKILHLKKNSLYKQIINYIKFVIKYHIKK